MLTFLDIEFFKCLAYGSGSPPSSVRLDGLDISIESTPPMQWLPANVTFRQWDVHSDVPDDLIGVYDIVHISPLTFVIKNEAIPAVMGRLLKLLSELHTYHLMALLFSGYILI